MNLKKHGVEFSEAETAFFDSEALVIPDIEHSNAEERFVLLGLSSKLKLLVVVHLVKESEDTIRIISARKANKRETTKYTRRQYESTL